MALFTVPFNILDPSCDKLIQIYNYFNLRFEHSNQVEGLEKTNSLPETPKILLEYLMNIVYLQLYLGPGLYQRVEVVTKQVIQGLQKSYSMFKYFLWESKMLQRYNQSLNTHNCIRTAS